MSRYYTLMFIDDDGSSVRRTVISKKILLSASLFFFCLFVALVYVFVDYSKLKHTSFQTKRFEKRLLSSRGELENQRLQIQLFAEEINNLKKKMESLNTFETKVAETLKSKKVDKDVFQGMGGSMPEDIKTNISLEDRHNSLLREMHQQLDVVVAEAEKQEDDFNILLKSLESLESQRIAGDSTARSTKNVRNLVISSIPSLRPVAGGNVTSRFGYRESPFGGRSSEFHKGYDIASKVGTPVRAGGDGVVSFAGDKGSYGKTILISHGHGMVTQYSHLSSFKLKAGDRVKRGEVVGGMGSTGRSTGSHLHYEVHLNGVPVNPQKYM